MQKTIFIIITRSFITRNILRSGALDLLKKSGHRVVVFFPIDSVPQYLKKEFEDKQVKLLGVKVNTTPWHRLFVKMKRYLMLNGNTKVLIFYGRNRKNWQDYQRGFIVKKSPLFTWCQFNLIRIISKIHFLRKIYRYLDRQFFPEENPAIIKYFNQYQPDLVFSTSIISLLDIAFMKEAKRRGVKTVSMAKSWDNLPSEYYRFEPDYFLLPSPFLAKMAHKIQDIPRDKIYVMGIPQFDWYQNKKIIRSREEHFKIKGLDPNKKLIFFGSAGIGASNDHYIAEIIYGWIKNNELAKPGQLLVRPHFSTVKNDVFKKLRGLPDVVIDEYRIIDSFSHSWDPTIAETIDFTNSVVHCDIMINVASTLSLDAACVDRPIINPAFGAFFEDDQDITARRNYGTTHYQWVLSTKATAKVDTPEKLKKQINKYLLNPKLQAEERAELREKLCYKVDGQSSERLVNVLNKII